LNFLRKKKVRFSEIENTEIAEEKDNDLNIFSITPEKIHEEIKKIPDKARVVLNLYLLEDYKHKEIAGMLNISESTSKSQYQRAKEILKERLNKEVSYEI
jgi:RNA polymerase sigma-70 factor (ECF subfamily)